MVPRAQVQALAYKGMPVVLHFQRRADAQWQPFELHLARCTRWGRGVQLGLETGRTLAERREPRRGGWGEGPAQGNRDRGYGGRGGGTPRSQQAAEETADEQPAQEDPWAV